jgi:nucleosome assembly protein 1-like 1
MGRKDKQAQPKNEKTEEPPKIEEKVETKEDKKDDKKPDKEPEEEDPPIVKELKALDDKYLAIEREYEKEVEELKKQYLAKKQPLLAERQTILVGEGDVNSKDGTPKLSGFWRKAMTNHPAFEDSVQEWDEPVLDCLRNVTWEPLEENAHSFKLIFTFAENSYFEPKVLTKEYHCVEDNPYTQEIDVKKTVCTDIEWHPGKDVTVEKIAKKVKGGGAKKAKQKGKETIEPRDSIFRCFFRSVDSDQPLPDDLKNVMEMMDDEDDDDSGGSNGLTQMFLENDYETGMALKDQVVPFAVRWYTGEAAPDDDDSDGEDSEEEDDDDDDSEEDDDESEEPSPKGKKGKNKAGGGKKSSPKVKPADAPKEECKQQ